MHVLIPCYTRVELETLVPVVRELPTECTLTVVVDPQYVVLDVLDEVRNRQISKIPIGSIPFDVRKFLTENGVSLILTAHDASLIAALFLITARKIGIASVYVPHGALSATRGKMTALKLIAAHAKAVFLAYAERYVASGCLAEAARIWASKFLTGRSIFRLWDVACVAGPASKLLFLKSGIPEDATVVTGQPRYDSLVKINTPKDKNHVVELLGLETGTPVVVVATQPFVEDGLWTPDKRARFVELVVKAVREAGGQALLKLHPREAGVAVYRTLLATITNAQVPIIKDEVDLVTVLTIGDALLTVRSAIGLEAMLFGLPVIAFVGEDVGSTADELDYVEYGASLGVRDEKDLTPSIAAVLFDAKTRAGLAEASKRYVYDHAYLQDGLAGARVAKVILSQLKERALEGA